MSVTYNGISTVGCCEFKGRPTLWDTFNPPSLQSLWNDNKFSDLREALGKDTISGSGCEGCAKLLRNDQVSELVEKPEGMNKYQEKNWKKMVEASMQGTAFLASAPHKLALCFSPVCNLRCVMCSQEYFYLEQGGRELSADLILAEREFLSKVNTIELCGGEVFASREAVKFLEGLGADEELRNTRLFIVSNGLLLHKVMPVLESFSRLKLHVSLDGVGETYEKIRKRGKWDRVAKNIDMFLEAMDKPDREWTLTTSCVLLRSAVERIESFVDWVLERSIPVTFQRLLPTRFSFDEDLMGNPEARREIDWRGNLARAAVRVRERGQLQAAQDLESYIRDLDEAPDEIGVGRGVSNWREYLDSEEARDKAVMIWGTGSNYRIYYADWLEKNKEKIRFLGFIDNDESRWGESLDGYKVYSPDEAQSLKPELIYRAVTLIWREQIAQQVEALGFSDVTVI